MPGHTITLILSANLLAKIDQASKINYCTRSDYIRSSVVQRLNQEQITDTPKGPVPEPVEIIQQTEAEFLKALEERYSQNQ